MSIQPELFASELLAVLEETFTQTHGVYLDGGTSLRETLAALSAEQASVAPCAGVFPVCAHASHALQYLLLLERLLNGEEDAAINDWNTTWQTLQVTPSEWAQLQTALLETYARLAALLGSVGDWNADDRIGNALAIIAHTAYHIGAVRQIAAQTNPSPSLPPSGSASAEAERV